MNGKSIRAVVLIGVGALALVGLLLWLSTAAPVRANPDTRYVAPDGDDSKTCDSIPNRCRTIQRAIDVADPGDEIRVAGGTYTSAIGTVAVITKELWIIGDYDPTFNAPDPDLYQTVLDAQWGGSVISITNAGDVLLMHLTLTHGDGAGNCPGGFGGCGGGIHATDTTLHVGHCIITDNVGSRTTTGAGGGIYVDNWFSPASVHIWESQIVSNAASTAGIGWGGGLHLFVGNASDPITITGNTFEDNTASTAGEGQGGGVYLYTYRTLSALSNNTFYHNYGSRAAGWGGGGGLYLWYSDGATLEANRFLSNTASALGSGYGGAIYASCAVVFTMTNNLLAQNQASTTGGGLRLDTWDPSYLIAGTLVNNTLADNDAGAGGEGIWVGRYVSLKLINNIIAGHTVGITNTAPASSTISADTNLFWDTTDPITGTNAILRDPLLRPDYHLGSGSPAFDAGLTIPWLTVDLEGTPRPQGSGYDIGAFETRWKVCLPLILKGY